MIYLIDDDRRGQQDAYGCDFLKTTEYDGVITTLKTVHQGSDISFLKDAKSILIHSSFPDTDQNGQIIEGKNVIYDKILELAENNSIPTMIFTNSILDVDHRAKVKGTAYRMNKRFFYLNLKAFVNYYRAENIIEFKNLYSEKIF